MKFLIKGIMLLAILMVAINVDAQPSAKCRDKELEVACKTAIEAADELLKQKDAKELFLHSQLKISLDQLDIQSKKLKEYETLDWYKSPTTIFLLGFISGIIINEKMH